MPSAFTQTTSSELLSSDYDNNSPQARHASFDSGAGLHDQIPLAQAALATAELMMHVESRDVSPWGSIHSSTETCQGTINPCELSKNLDVLSSTSISSYRSPSPSLSSLTDGTSSLDGTWTDSRESTASCFTSHSGSPALGHDYASPTPLDSSPYNLQHHSQYVTTEEDDCCDPRTVVKQEDDGLYAQWINGANTVPSNALSSSVPRKKGRCSPGNGRFVCEKCGLGCSRKFNLRQHMSTHLAFRPRPHSCEFCDMKFLRANERRRHEDSVS